MPADPVPAEAASLYASATAFEVSVDDATCVVWAARLADRPSTEAPRVLLLHGNPADLDDWRVLGPLLEDPREIVAADLPGFGRSQAVRPGVGGSRLDPAARAMIGLADALGWSEPFVVVGHSYGGAVAQVLAARFPDRIAGIVLIGSLGWPAHAVFRLLDLRLVGHAVAILAALLRRGRCVLLFRWLFTFWMRRIFSPAKPTWEEIRNRQSRFLARPDLIVSMVEAARGRPSDELRSLGPGLRTRVLVLHGDDDCLVPSRNVANLLERMESVREPVVFELLSGAGHMAHLTHARTIARRIASWL